MNAQVQKLKALKKKVELCIPDCANTSNLWKYLGWNDDARRAYLIAKKYGIDARPLLAPEFSDIISIVVDGMYNFPFPPKSFSWTAILNGEVAHFSGTTPKERLLSVIDCTIRNNLHS